jgi:hypothetical protein
LSSQISWQTRSTIQAYSTDLIFRTRGSQLQAL